MANRVGGRLAAVGKLIKEAQIRDVNGDDLGAYLHYLGCVQYMVQTLSGDSQGEGQGTLPPQHVLQLFTLAKNCLERAESIYTTAQKEGRSLTAGGNQLSAQQSHRTATANAHTPLPGQQSDTTDSGSNLAVAAGVPPSRTQSSPGRTESLGNQGERTTRPAIPRSNSRTDRLQSQPVIPLHRFSYMDEANMKNRYMMEQYKAFLRESSTRMLPPGVGLSMLRRLEENVSVARIREQNISRKLRERELRLRHEAESKTARHDHVLLSSLPIEELCEQVATFEHNKQNLNALKSKLDGSATSKHASNLINEVLNTADHPLSRLLGECQFSVYQLLRPVGIAVERAGGLPRLEICLDTGATQQSEPDGKAHQPSPASSHSRQPLATQFPSTEDDSHLDLLCDEEDEDFFSSATAIIAPQENSVPTGLLDGNSTDPMEDKLQQLRSSLMEEVVERERHESGSSGGGTQRSVTASEVSSGGDRGEAGMKNQECKNGNQISDTGPDPTYINVMDLPIYMNTQANSESLHEHGDNIESFLKGPGTCHELTSDNHIYDSVFLPDSGHVSGDLTPSEYGGLVGENTPDGGMFSKPGGGGEAPPVVEEPPVVFKNLPPLVCRMQMGDERMLMELVITARSVLKDVVRLIRQSFKKIEEVFVTCYPPLASENNREICQTIVEASFFPAILHPLTMLYRCKNYQEELTTARNICHHANTTPKDLSVRRKFWLIEQAHAPYGEAIDELRHLPSLNSPTPKLECLVHMSKLIIQCIDSYHEVHGKGSADIGVGVDDILPILTYIIIRSGLPQLVSECSIMEEFIHEGYMKGEEGFCLTSFQTALRFVSRMSS